jgi:hypothetical protein
MKEPLFYGICICIIIVLNGLGAAAGSLSETKNISETIHFSELTFNKIHENLVVTLKNADSELKRPGYPLLPCFSKTYVFPFETDILDVTVTFSGMEPYALQNNIVCAPQPLSVLSGTKVSAKTSDTGTQPPMYPAMSFQWFMSSGVKNNNQALFLTVKGYPIRYNSVDNILYASQIATISIAYDVPDQPVVFPNDYDLVIIAPQLFSRPLQQLVDHKETHNINTLLKTVEDIYEEYNGVDNAEKIKYFILDAKETYGARYVLLFGGMKGQRYDWFVPVRYSHLDDGSNFETSFISDLYYADLYDAYGNFSDWDPNGNGIFAEWNQDEQEIIDMMPDIIVGRLPCRSLPEVYRMVDKIITYETGASHQEWFSKMVVVGGDSAPGYQYYEGEEENKKALEYMEEFEGVKLWTSDGSLSGVDDVVEAISDGCGFLFFDGHGNPSTWSTHPPDDEETWITGLDNKDMPKLSNDEQLPVCVVGGCHNAQFNVTFMNFLKGILEYKLKYFNVPSEDDPFLGPFWRKEWVPECWAWRLVRKIGGGAIAIMGYTGLDWFAEGDYNQDGIPDCIQYYSGFANTHFFKNYGVNNLTILGEAHTQTLVDYLTTFPPMSDEYDCKTAQEFVLLGDPSLQIGGVS